VEEFLKRMASMPMGREGERRNVKYARKIQQKNGKIYTGTWIGRGATKETNVVVYARE